MARINKHSTAYKTFLEYPKIVSIKPINEEGLNPFIFESILDKDDAYVIDSSENKIYVFSKILKKV
jgi:hypothetical protein